MIDLVNLVIKAGNGGHGRVSFRREKYIPKGGPDGGDGGNGGSVIVRVNPKLGTLQHLAGIHQIEAQHGGNGGRRNMSGPKGEDVVIEVPPGTVIWLEAETFFKHNPRLKYALQCRTPKGEIRFKHYFLEKEGESIPAREENTSHPVEKTKLVELLADSPEITLVQGGFGGRGNDAFKSASNTTPLEADYGTWGEHKQVIFELKLLADVGFVGLPNAGKSTLLSRLTNARPKIANYPFTTLEPHLGVLAADEAVGQREIVLADIPGLIEGASQGKGLGFDFLRHLEHCQALIFVLALDDTIAADPQVDPLEKAAQLYSQLTTLKTELITHSPEFATKKSTVIINKADLYTPEAITAMTEYFVEQGVAVKVISAATGEKINELIKMINQLVE